MALRALFYTLFALSLPLGSFAQQPQAPLSPSDHIFTHPPYKIHIFSTSPLVIYISDFVSLEERSHLLEITKDTFSNSAVADSSGTQGLRRTRTSQSTTVPRDPVVRCVEDRALSFQGFTDRSHLEPLQLVQYAQNQSYHFHTDWFTNPSLATHSHGYNRLSSFFAYIDVLPSTTGGGTNFPLLNAPLGSRGDRWCEFVDCDTPYESGVTFRPLPGNAIFWRNLNEDGSGDERTLHAGLPVTSGGKVGMNIWTREGGLAKEFRGED